MQPINKKKLLLICGSSKAGADGVGDYSRKLGAFCASEGLTVTILAIRDRYTTEIIIEKTDPNFEVIRIPLNSKNQYRLNKLKEIIKNFNPDIVNIQFVIFGFHKKGLPFKFTKEIARIVKKTPIKQVMFHELWTGINAPKGTKLWLLGWVQKNLITAFLSKLKPTHIFTNTALYQNKLIKLGYENTIRLPLFSNITFLPKTTQPIRIKQHIPQTEGYVFSCFFGSIYTFESHKLSQHLNELSQIAQKENKKPCLLFIGKSQESQINLVKKIIDSSYPNIISIELGKLPEDDVSATLKICHYGLVTTPQYFEEKSGVRAAYLQHGLTPIYIGIEAKQTDGWTHFDKNHPSVPFKSDSMANISPPAGANYNKAIFDAWAKITQESYL